MSRERKIVEAYEAGASAEAIAAAWSASVPEISRIVREALGPRYFEVARRRIANGPTEAAPSRRRRRPPRPTRRLDDCAVCGDPLGHGRRVTCTAECAESWRRNRYRISPEERLAHREQRARVVLASPEKYPDRVEWARAVLSDSPPPFVAKGAQRRPRAARA